MNKLIHRVCTILFLALIGTVSQATTLQPGDLIISEVMANPAAVSDSNGEWFELFNTTANTISLNGLTISDDGSNSHIINSTGALLIASGEFFVLGNNGDMASNGGYTAHYVYSGFSLANSSDQIIITDNSSQVTRLDYSGSSFGNAGISAELIMQALNPAQTDYQTTPAETFFQYGDGDFGTPGSQGSLALTSASPVPVPGSIWLFGSALLVVMRRLSTV